MMQLKRVQIPRNQLIVVLQCLHKITYSFSEESDNVLPDFKKLNLSKLVRDALHESNPNVKSPTPIQQQAIPLILKWKSDLVIASHTGSGKTYAFLLPLIQMIKYPFHPIFFSHFQRRRISSKHSLKSKPPAGAHSGAKSRTQLPNTCKSSSLPFSLLSSKSPNL
jgi:hypothetical protein